MDDPLALIYFNWCTEQGSLAFEMSSEQELEELPRVELLAEVEQRYTRFKELYERNCFVIENRWIAMNKQARRELSTICIL